MSTHAPKTRLERTSYLALIALALASLLALAAKAQDDGQVYRVIDLGNQETLTGGLFASVELAPDGKTLAVAATQSYPFRFWDIGGEQQVRTIDVGNWYAGARATYSSTGKYLLLQQLFYLDFAPNKDRPVKYEAVEVASGRSVIAFEDLYAAALAPDEATLYTVDKNGVHIVDIASGKVNDARILERTGNAIAVSPDGARIAVAHRPVEADLEGISYLRNDKKAIKEALKTSQVVIVYDAHTLQPIHVANELFDKVFRLRYSPDGIDLWVHAKPHSRKGGNPNPYQSYVDVVDAITGEVRRTSFPSLALYEPDFRTSADGKLFAIGSQQGKFLEVHLYERATGRMLSRFTLTYRLFEKMKSKAEFPSDGRVSFVFLPDGKRMMMTFGNRLIEWTYVP